MSSLRIAETAIDETRQPLPSGVRAPNSRCCAMLIGTSAWSSTEPKPALPFSASTPITRRTWSFIRTFWPTAWPLPNRSSASVAPSTTTGEAPRTWPSSINVPLLTVRLFTDW